MNFADLLANYKDNPRRESAAILLDDLVLFRYCVLFKQVPIRRLDDYPLENTWPALWACVEVDIPTLAMLADAVEVEARKALERMKGLRLVYPDGTVQELVDRLIVKRLKDAMS